MVKRLALQHRLTSRMRGFTIDELRTLLAATRQAESSKALIEGEAHEVEDAPTREDDAPDSSGAA